MNDVCTLRVKDGEPNWCDHHDCYHVHHYAQYAVDPGPKGQKFRAYWDRQLGAPSLPRKVLNFAKASVQHVAGGSRKVPLEVSEARLAICKKNECGYFDAQKTRCLHQGCGCGLKRKVTWATSSCPVKLWGAMQPPAADPPQAP